jgi:hypothetical protein
MEEINEEFFLNNNNNNNNNNISKITTDKKQAPTLSNLVKETKPVILEPVETQGIYQKILYSFLAAFVGALFILGFKSLYTKFSIWMEWTDPINLLPAFKDLSKEDLKP